MKTLVVVITLVLAACGSTSKHVIAPNDGNMCAPACVRLRSLGCSEGEQLPPDAEHPLGASCEEFCVDTLKNGHGLDPTCIVQKVHACADLNTVCLH